MRKIIAGVIALLGMVGAAQASTIEDIAASTYKFYIDGRGGCSAEAISPTQLVTAFHCVNDGTGKVDPKEEFSVRVQTLSDECKAEAATCFEVLSEKVYYAKVVRGLLKKDVAFLELKDKSVKFDKWVDIAKPDEVKLTIGDKLISVGYPKAMEITLTHGEFSSMVPSPLAEWEGAFIKTTIPVTGGNSGGGLYAEIDGTYKLIGITSGGFRDVSFMNYWSNTNSLDEVIKGLITLPSDDKKEAVKTDVEKDAEVDDTKLINPADLR